MKTFAEIKDGVIVNTSVWDAETPQGEQFVEITDIENVGIGWSCVNGQFVEPVQPEPEIPESEIPNIES
jgi:hypothetical protein